MRDKILEVKSYGDVNNIDFFYSLNLPLFENAKLLFWEIKGIVLFWKMYHFGTTGISFSGFWN